MYLNCYFISLSFTTLACHLQPIEGNEKSSCYMFVMGGWLLMVNDMKFGDIEKKCVTLVCTCCEHCVIVLMLSLPSLPLPVLLHLFLLLFHKACFSGGMFALASLHATDGKSAYYMNNQSRKEHHLDMLVCYMFYLLPMNM